jgi:hypothetical protein
MDQAGESGQNFFLRLIVKADDFGRYTADPELLHSALYPRASAGVAQADVVERLARCEAAGLVLVYTVEGKPYLVIPKFGQRVRGDRSKYPDPPADKCAQLSAECGQVSDTRGQLRPYSETYSETETKAQALPPTPPGGAGGRSGAGWEKFWTAYPKKFKRANAQAAYESLNPGPELLAAILAGLGRAKRSADWTREGGRFVPLAAAWLADRGWEGYQLPASRPPPDPGEGSDGSGAGVAWRAMRAGSRRGER